MKSICGISLFVALCCFPGVTFGQAGAPTQRVHIPGIPDGTSIYAASVDQGSYVTIGCISKTSDGGFIISDWRGAQVSGPAGAPPFAATAPLIFRLEGNHDMLNFQTGHEVQIIGPILETAKDAAPAKMKVERLLYLSRSCWQRGTTEPIMPKQ